MMRPAVNDSSEVVQVPRTRRVQLLVSAAARNGETVGERLRRLRTEAGLSQRQLSEPGVSYAYISRIEAGARRPSTRALRKIAPKLGITADELEFGDVGIKGNPTFRSMERRIVQLEAEKRELQREVDDLRLRTRGLAAELAAQVRDGRG